MMMRSLLLLLATCTISAESFSIPPKFEPQSCKTDGARIFSSLTDGQAPTTSADDAIDDELEALDFNELIDLYVENFEEDLQEVVPDSRTDDEQDEDLIESHKGGNPTIDSNNEIDELEDLLATLTDTPVGTIELNDLAFIRETVETLVESLLLSDNCVDSAIANTVEQLLYRMVAEYTSAAEGDASVDQLQSVEPAAADFHRVLKTWEVVVRSDSERPNTSSFPEAIDRVRRIINYHHGLATNGIIFDRPSPGEYETVLRVMTKSRERGIDRVVRDIFESIPQKTCDMYSLVIPCLAKSRDRGAAERAEKLLREAVEHFPPVMENSNSNTGISIDCCNVVLTAWAKSGLDYGPKRAEELIVFMDTKDREHGNHGIIKPNIFSFTSLIDAYAQKRDWDGASQSERILNNLLNQYLEGEEGIPEPSVASWTIAISAWARISKKGFRGAAKRAGKLLTRMETLHEEGRIGFGPDAIVYVTCMNAYAFSKASDGPANAEEILDHTNQLYLEGDETMKPSIRSIGIVLDAWIRSNSTDAMEEAELLFERYEDPISNDSSEEEVRNIYKGMLFGWAKKGHPDHAQHYLNIMIGKGMKPDSFCFDRVIEANTLLNDEGAFQRSCDVFNRMESCRKSGDILPNERLYTSFIRAMTKARIPNLAHKANVLTRRMSDLYEQGNQGIRPTVFTYNAVLMACAETPSTPDPEPMPAFKIAIQVFNDLRKNESPDHVSFGNMLRCARLLPEGEQRDSVIKSTFSLCAQSGFVNDFVVRDLQSSGSESLWRELLRVPVGDQVNVDELPRQWRSKFEKRRQLSRPPFRQRTHRR